MANQTTLVTKQAGKDVVVIELRINSDGTEETALVVYDSSAIATTLGLADTLTCKLRRVKGQINSGGTSGVLANAQLLFDATTDINAASLPVNESFDLDFRKDGAIVNNAGSGKTGDILLTTTGLIANDSIVLRLEVVPY